MPAKGEESEAEGEELLEKESDNKEQKSVPTKALQDISQFHFAFYYHYDYYYNNYFDYL